MAVVPNDIDDYSSSFFCDLLNKTIIDERIVKLRIGTEKLDEGVLSYIYQGLEEDDDSKFKYMAIKVP